MRLGGSQCPRHTVSTAAREGWMPAPGRDGVLQACSPEDGLGLGLWGWGGAPWALPSWNLTTESSSMKGKPPYRRPSTGVGLIQPLFMQHVWSLSGTELSMWLGENRQTVIQ